MSSTRVKPMKTARSPVELESELTPVSALYYEIEGGPVRVMTPSLTQSNRVAWAAVRATGTKKIEAQGQDKTLSPSLIFQARMLSGAVESVAYGQRSKVSEDAAKAAKKLEETQTSK